MVATKKHQITDTLTAADKRLLTERDVERIYGIPRLTLQRWRFLGRGPHYVKLGGRSVRYVDVDAWIAAQPCGGDGYGRPTA